MTMNFFAITTTLLLGACVGSFISLLIERIYKKESGILLGRSHCPACKKVLKALHLIPILSYIYLKGKCAFCKRKISPLYPTIELTSALVYLMLYLYYPMAIFHDISGMTIIVLQCYIFFALIFTFFYDLKYMIISDRILLPAIVIAFLLPTLDGYPLTFLQALAGFSIPTLFFLIQIFISNGRWLGGGDLRIGALMGAFLGVSKVLVALFSAYMLGSILCILLLTTTKLSRKSMIPFGPFLVCGTLLSFFLGDDIVEAYMRLYSIY